MTSFYYGSIPTHGNWFQTNQPEHGWDDHAGDPVTSVCVTNEKDMALQWQIWSTFVTVLWCRKKWNYRRDWDIGSCDFQDLLTILAKFLLKCTWKQLQFQSHWNNVEKNGTFSLFDTRVNGNVTFAYIMRFHCTSAFFIVYVGLNV